MARIRTIKPEAFSSESLAEVTVTAERTFFGLLTQADDHGRFRDQAAVIAGLLWSLRPEHGPVGVEDDLNQLDTAELICRYEGSDGKRYLHIVTFAKHQKINRPSGVRHPGCPHHDGGRPGTVSRQDHGPAPEAAVKAQEGLSEPSRSLPEASVNEEIPGQGGFSEPSRKPQGGLRDLSVSPHGPDLGPRNRDLGTTPLGGASAPIHPAVSTKELIAEYTAACTHRPPSSVLGHLGREVGKLLTEGIDADHIRAGLDRLRTKSLHASLLPSLVNEAMNTPRPTASDAIHRTYTNPTDVEAAYGGEL
ncbi:hypothetical protein [Streptomyces sp. NBC_00690]|uniref:hypothetical protein n=1 Tax=Streptomyces sp. NBC_00690 TaxID=2975808 RepID=UPI002E2C8A18|nr:hypothetical protein [Streptomyces sp. NBC_00690]